MEKLTAEQYGYIAGLIDAECSIQIQKRLHKSEKYIYEGYSLYLDMSNTNKDLILWLVVNIGGSWGKKKAYNPRCKQAFYWRCGGKECQKILKKIIHLLIDKRERALLAVTFPLNHSKYSRDFKDNLYYKMKELNLRGSQILAATTECVNSEKRCDSLNSKTMIKLESMAEMTIPC